VYAIQQAMDEVEGMRVTLPTPADPSVVASALEGA
jgi:hypothetical protein